MASQALCLTATLVLLIAAPCAFCAKISAEDKNVCFQEATESSSVSEEDKARALEISHQVHREMVQMFKEKGKEAMKELAGKDMVGEKVDAAEDIKDKVAAKNFLKALGQCAMTKGISSSLMRCQKAKEANNDRLTAEDLQKALFTVKKAYTGSGGAVSEEDLEKKFTEALGSEEKAKVAMEVHKALHECAMEFKSSKAAKKE
ncbi:hypothetical protein V5799_018684 [Amblyomma americanum]|uniref:Secreted protein n=1 Tax=Amblyomma americanum TaxID=6943 RepID=A0AAQ4EZN5_AMBAM